MVFNTLSVLVVTGNYLKLTLLSNLFQLGSPLLSFSYKILTT